MQNQANGCFNASTIVEYNAIIICTLDAKYNAIRIYIFDYEGIVTSKEDKLCILFNKLMTLIFVQLEHMQ